MIVRLTLATVVCSLAAVVGASISMSATPAAVSVSAASAGNSTTVGLRNCGTVVAAGKTWRVSAAGVSCADARTLVRKLAPKAVRAGVNHATYLGLSCYLATKPGGASAKAPQSGIQCVGAQGRKSVMAFAR